MDKLKCDFNRDFQEGILHFFLIDKKFADFFVYKLTPDYFSADLASLSFRFIKKFYDIYHKIEYKNILNEVGIDKRLSNDKKKELKKYLKKTYKKSTNYKYILDNTTQFIKSRVYFETLDECYESVEDGNFVNVINKINNLSRMEFQIDEGLETSAKTYKNTLLEINDRERNNVNYLSTGITPLDHYIKGLRNGELGVIAAPPSGGKSFFLLHIAKYALYFNLNVLYYTLEQNQDLITRRIMMSISNMTSKDTIEKEKLALKNLKRLKKNGGRFIVKHFPKKKTVADLRLYTNYLINKGFVPDVVLVDYADYLKSVERIKEKRHELTDIFYDLYSYAEDYDVPLWTASGTTKEASKKQVVAMEDMKETYEKAYIADIVLGICQTVDECKEDNDGYTRARIYIAKNRNRGNKGKIIEIVQDEKRMQFYKPNVKY